MSETDRVAGAWGTVHRARTVGSRLRTWLPTGGLLRGEGWSQRHRWILRILWTEALIVGMASILKGNGIGHSAVNASLVAILAVGATAFTRRQRLSTVLAAVGLLTASAVSVHLFHGRIEMHFSYFVAVGLITLYQDWAPLLVSIGYVILQHGVGGAIDPSMMYGHTTEQPWILAGVHGAFILAMTLVGVVAWRMNELWQLRANERELRLAEAQHVAGLGSWEANLARGTFDWSDELFRLFALDPARDHGSVEVFIGQIDENDQMEVQNAIHEAFATGTPAAGDFRINTGSGAVRWVHGRVEGRSFTDGRVSIVAGTVLDITSRIAAEAERADTLSQLSATLDATAEGILVVSNSGVLSNVNRRFVDLFGLSLESPLPMATEDVLPAVMAQIKDPGMMKEWIGRVTADPTARSDDIVELTDGRVFEFSYMPQTIAGRAVGRVWSVRDLTDRVLLERALTQQALHDSLTGLANKSLFKDRVDHAIGRLEREDQAVSVLFIDLDEFKNVNDGLGHSVGDELLVAVAARFSECVRPSDTIARLGGDEFAVLIENMEDPTSSEAVAVRLLSSLDEPFLIAARNLHVRASIGVVHASRGATGEQLLRDADVAMYAAKRDGKHRHKVFVTGTELDLENSLELEVELRQALDVEQVAIHYQATPPAPGWMKPLA